MKKIEMTRRQLLQASSALGFSVAIPLILGLAGCNSNQVLESLRKAGGKSLHPLLGEASRPELLPWRVAA